MRPWPLDFSEKNYGWYEPMSWFAQWSINAWLMPDIALSWALKKWRIFPQSAWIQRYHFYTLALIIPGRSQCDHSPKTDSNHVRLTSQYLVVLSRVLFTWNSLRTISPPRFSRFQKILLTEMGLHPSLWAIMEPIFKGLAQSYVTTSSVNRDLGN